MNKLPAQSVLFENHPDPMWIYEIESLRFLEVNHAAVAKYGYSRDEFLAMTIADIRPAEDVSALVENVRAVSSGLDEAGVWRHRLASGVIILVEIRSHTLEYEGKRAELVVVRDLTRLVDLERENSALLSRAADEADDEGAAQRTLSLLQRTRELRVDNSRLQEQQANLRTAQRLLSLGIWKLNTGTGALSWSDNVYDMYGIAREDFGHDFDAYVELVHPDDRETMRSGYAEFEATSPPYYDFEHRIVRPDGKVIHVKGIGELTDMAEGRVLTGVVQDITRQVIAGARLREATSILQLAGRAARLGGWRFELNPERLTWTAETAAIHEVPRGYAPTLDRAFDFYPPEYQEKIREAVRRCIDERASFDEILQIVTANGHRVWVRAIGVAETGSDGRIIAVQGAFQDVSELIAARDLSRELSNKLVMTFESMSDAFVMLDTDWCFSFMNSQAEQLLQRPRAGLIGRHIWEEFPAAVGTGFQREYERAVASRQTVQFTEYYPPPLDIWLDVSAYPTADGLAIYFRDITERRELEDRLRQAQKLEAVGQLTGGVAHDFNNLLTVILGNAELLCEQLSDQHQLRVLAEMTATAAERGAELTHRLLAFARRQALEPRPVNVNRLVTGMDPMLRRTLTEDLDIEVVQAGNLWRADVDPGQLEVSLLNLAINSRDAMPGGGCLTIETANCVLDEAYANAHEEVTAGQYVMVSVSDTGTGMTPETVARAFEPFFTTKPVGKGSGLGLSMVYGFIKQTGGHVRIYSEVDQGTTIKLYLPRSSGPDDELAQDQEPGIVGGSEHILVVEDDYLVREHLVAQLRELGYQVTAADSAPPALEVLEQAPDIDLLFTDIVMPGGMNGRQLADAAQALRPGLKVLFTSGYTENAIVHHGRLDRGVHLLSKPYRRQEVAAKVRMVLDESGDEG